MSVTIIEKEHAQKELRFSLTPQDMEQFLDGAAQRLSQNMKVKGFRDGHVPRAVVEKSMGADAVWREAVGEAVEESYVQAIQEHHIEPIGRPRVDITKLVPGNNVEFTVLVPLSPAIMLPDYRAIAKAVKKDHDAAVAVSEKEVEDTLKWLRQSRVSAGAGGKKSADKKEVPLPPLDDAFARSVGDFKDLAALQASIREGITREKEQQKAQAMRLKIIEAVQKKMTLDIADVLIENELDRMQDEFSGQVDSMGTTLEEYLKKIGKTLGEVRDGWKEKARDRVALGLILRAIADAEDIEVPSEDVEKEAKRYLQQFKSVPDAEQAVNPQALRSYMHGILRNEKVFKLLEQSSESK
jgi:trigger factor